MVDSSDKKESWEKLWKKFGDIVGFTHDNEGVITSMEIQKEYSDQPSIKETLTGQEEEIAKLIRHHEEDLKNLLQEAKKLATDLHLSVEKELHQLEEAIEEHNVDKMEEMLKKIKGKEK